MSTTTRLEANGPPSIGYTLGQNALGLIFRCLYTTTGKIESGSINLRFLPSSLLGSKIYLQIGSCDNLNGITYVDFTSPQPAATYQVANNFLNLTEGTLMPTWTFCYKASQYGQGNLLYQCEKSGVYSPISSVNITVYPQQPASNDVPSSVFYLLNPIITLVILLVLFAVRRKYVQSRFRQQQQQLLRAQQQQQRSQRRPPTRVMSYAEPQFSIDSVEELTDVIFPIRLISVNRNNSNDSNNPNPPNTNGGLSAEMIATIPIEKYQLKAEEELCVICQSNFEENDSVRRLNCNHLYHVPCIDAWLTKSLSCPICVTNVMVVV